MFLKINFATTNVAFGEEQHDITWQLRKSPCIMLQSIVSLDSVDVKRCEMMGLQIWNLDVKSS
jgi:hypothetical protein